MSSTFVNTDEVKVKLPFRSNATNIPVFIQFVPGKVKNLMTNVHSSGVRNSKDINAIWARPYLTDSNDGSIGGTTSLKKYLPLLRGITDVPTIGDQVLLCTFAGRNYYLGPINVDNNPTVNEDNVVPANEDDLNFLFSNNRHGVKRTKSGGTTKIIDSHHKRLHKLFNYSLDNLGNDPNRIYSRNIKLGSTEDGSVTQPHGDLMIEGRHGNSIRVGSRHINPYIYISNGRSVANDTESLGDGNLISITNKGALNQHFSGYTMGDDWSTPSLGTFYDKYTMGCNMDDENPRKFSNELFNIDYSKNQILMKSNGKITIDSQDANGGLFMSSQGIIGMGSARNIFFRAKNTIQIDAKNIYIGKIQDDDGNKLASQPMVFGKKLIKVLENLVDAILKTELLVKGPSGPTNSVQMSGDVGGIADIKNELTSIISNYHFIEDNNDGKEKHPKTKTEETTTA